MMKRITICLLIACFAVLLSACSKTQKAKGWLKKGSGEWQVKSIALKNNPFGPPVLYPSMKYIFDETGSFIEINYLGPEQIIMLKEEAGEWSVKKGTISLEYLSGEKQTWKILTMEKNKMELENTGSNYYSEAIGDIMSLEKTD